MVEYAYTTIPTYIGGQIGFLLNSKNSETNFRVSCFLIKIQYSQTYYEMKSAYYGVSESYNFKLGCNLLG